MIDDNVFPMHAGKRAWDRFEDKLPEPIPEKKDLPLLLKETMVQGFPDLTGVRVSLEIDYFKGKRPVKIVGAYPDYTMKVKKEVEKYFVEDIETKESENYPPEVVVGGFAHELSHVVRIKRLNPFLNLFDEILYNTSRRYKASIEREADYEAIKRGFGKELIYAIHQINASGKLYTKEDGLTEEEIGRLIMFNRNNPVTAADPRRVEKTLSDLLRNR